MMMNDRIYQLIFNELAKYLPNSWDRLVVYLEHGEGSYSYSFFVKVGNSYTKCYDLKGINEDDLMTSFSQIEKAVAAERAKCKAELWSNMTMVVEATGKMKTAFDYTDLSSGSYQYKKSWKKAYLV